MSKNKGKGGKGKRKGKKQTEDRSRELEFKDESQEYAQVTKMLGNSRLEANCMDGTVRVCHIRGKFRKRVWINQGDIVLLGLRDFQDEKADVILKYSPEEAKLLKAYGELPESIIIGGGRGEGEADGGEGGGIAFGDGSDTEGEGEGEDVKKESASSSDEDKETVDWNKELENL